MARDGFSLLSGGRQALAIVIALSVLAFISTNRMVWIAEPLRHHEPDGLNMLQESPQEHTEVSPPVSLHSAPLVVKSSAQPQELEPETVESVIETRVKKEDVEELESIPTQTESNGRISMPRPTPRPTKSMTQLATAASKPSVTRRPTKKPTRPATAAPTRALDPDLPPECGTPLHFLDKRHRKGPVAFASFPGSGNTWIRHVIQQGTRLYTGSMYNDRHLHYGGFLGEKTRDRTVVAIKTHFPCKNCWMVDRENYRPVKATGDIPKATHAIYMLRSPFDALLAEFNRLYSGSHTGSSSASSFQGSRWANFVQLKGESWAFHANYWLSQKDGSVENLWRDERGIPVYLYYFENLVSNFKTEVVQILQQLRSIQGEENLPAPEIGLQCVLHERDGNFKRKAGKIFNPYTAEQVEYICEISRRFWNEEVWGPCNGQLQKERKLTTSRLPIDMQNNTQDET